jgi:preprotein translocase subunit SecA
VFNLEVEVEPETGGAEAEDGPAQAVGRHREVVAKGLDAPRRPARLEYSAPTIDGDTADGGGVATAVEVDDNHGYGDVPRNAPCPCGSGKKFKRCHGDPRNRAG